jgi:hypothetical protein
MLPLCLNMSMILNQKGSGLGLKPLRTKNEERVADKIKIRFTPFVLDHSTTLPSLSVRLVVTWIQAVRSHV